jgi:hypothetical protein
VCQQNLIKRWNTRINKKRSAILFSYDDRRKNTMKLIGSFSLRTCRKRKKYPMPWEGIEPVRCETKCTWYEREAACLQPGECRSHSLLFYFWFSDSTRRSSNPSLPSLLLNQLQRVTQYIAACGDRWLFESVAANMEVRSSVDIFVERLTLFSFILSFCSFLPFPQGMSNYFITLFVFMYHSVHYLLVATFASGVYPGSNINE